MPDAAWVRLLSTLRVIAPVASSASSSQERLYPGGPGSPTSAAAQLQVAHGCLGLTSSLPSSRTSWIAVAARQLCHLRQQRSPPTAPRRTATLYSRLYAGYLRAHTQGSKEELAFNSLDLSRVGEPRAIHSFTTCVMTGETRASRLAQRNRVTKLAIERSSGPALRALLIERGGCLQLAKASQQWTPQPRWN